MELAKSRGPRGCTLLHAASSVVVPVLQGLALAISSLGLVYAAPPAATQLPTGGQVVAGQASLSQSGGKVLSVNQSSQAAIVNWQSFNVGSSAAVNFNQPSTSSSTLNRVLDSNPSQIYGRITAPGQVFFTNPNGMYFGPGASVEVGGLTATTHGINDADFMAGNYRFARDGATGAISNDGTLTASLGGYIALLAPEVRNRGVIIARMGTVALAAGEVYELQMQGSQLSQLRVSPATIQALVDNASAVLAPGGLVILSAQAADQLQGSVVNSSGALAAQGLSLRNGRVVLDAGSNGSVNVSGSISTRNDSGNGGDTTLTGNRIHLQDGAQLDASGSNGGGNVRVGGDWQGSGTLLQATRVTMDANASIDASATQSGNGGKVVLWSDVHAADGQTVVAGSITARGGVLGGNGGQIETSGHAVDISGLRVNVGADRGAGGQWLLDPFDYTIDAAAAATIIGSLDAGGAVTITTANNTGPGAGASGLGDITVNSAIAKTSASAASLTLTADHSIVLNADITSSSVAMATTLNAATGSISGAGNINTFGGLLTLNAAGAGVLSGAITGAGALTASGAGTVILSGNNTYAGTTTISSTGKLQIGNGGTSGAITSPVSNNGTLTYNRSDATTLTNTITNNVGSASVVFAGTGKVTITSGGSITNPAATVTVNSGSVLEICDGVSTNCNLGPSHVVLNGELIYNKPAIVPIITKYFSGSGNLTIASGVFNLTTTTPSTYTGTTTVAPGSTFNLGGTAAGGVTGAGLLTGGGPIVNNGTFQVNHSDAISLSNNISGSGVVNQIGAGTTTLTGTNSYSGTTTITAGTLKIGNGGSSGTLGSGAVTDNTALVFNRTGTLTVAGDISGSGTLTQAGTGTTALTGSNSYAGATTISAGTLQIGNGGSTGTLGTGAVTDNAALMFNRAADTTISNTISGTGTIDATVTGNLTVAGTMTQSNTVHLQATQGLTVNAAITSAGGATLTSGGNMALNANISNSSSGAVTARAGDGSATSAATLTATAAATITQNADADVLMSTDGNGNLTPAKVIKTATGAGNIILAAGKQIAAGNGSGGQVTPISGNSVTNAGTGGVYVYSGNIASTGDLGLISTGLGSLNYNGTTAGATNTAFTQAYGSSISNGSATQLLVRETPVTLPSYSIALDNATLGKAYGNVDPTVTDLRSSLQNAYTGPATLSTSYGGKIFTLAAADVLAGITASRAAGENVGSHAYSGLASSANLHTAVSNTPAVTLLINQRDITLASLTATNKTYDGTTDASITGGSFNNLVGTETLAISGAGTFDNRNAGTGKTVTVSDVASLSKADGTGLWSNYHLTTSSLSTTADVAKRAVTITTGNIGKSYDGLPDYTARAADLTALSGQLGISGDSVSAATMTYSDKNADTGNKTVALGSVTISDGNSGNNYSTTLVGNSTSTITKADAVVTANSDTSRVYNGNTQTVTGFSATGLVNNETSSVLSSVSASGAGKNAGDYAVTANGTDANYNLTFVNGLLHIDRATLSAALTGTVSKQYDGFTSAGNLASSNYAVSGWAPGEGAAVTQSTGSYASKNVDANAGTGAVSTTLASSQFSANAGTDLSNYVLPTAASGNVGRITPAPLNVKVNDSATFVTLNPNAAPDQGLSFTGLQNGESGNSVLGALSRSYTGAANPVAGNYGAVFGLGSTPVAANGNYGVSVTKGNLVVVPADNIIINVGSNRASYGSLNAATAGASAQAVSVDYMVGGTTLAHLTMQSLGSGLWQATDATNNTLGFSTLVNSSGALSSGGYLNHGNYSYGATRATGTASGNFNGQVVNGGVLTIDPLALNLTNGSISKTYDGSTSLAASAGLTAANVASGDKLGIAFGSGSFAGRNAGSQTFSMDGLSLTGADKVNYALPVNSYGGTGSITAKNVTLATSNLSKTYDGSTAYTATAFDLAQLSGQLGVAGDSVTAATLAYTNANAGSGKTVSTSAASISDGNGGANYAVHYADTSNSQILKKQVSLSSISAAGKTYDGSTMAGITGSITGTVAGETLSMGGSGSFTDRNAGNNKAVTVADITSLTKTDGSGLWSNYQLSNSGSMGTTASIARKSVTLTAGNLDKTYDGLYGYTLLASDLAALSKQLGVGADVVSAAIIRYLDRNAGNGKTVTFDSATIQDGNGGNNYDITLVGNSSSHIGKATLRISANNVIKAQDGIAYFGGNGVRYAGFVNGEDLSALTGTLAYAGNSQGAVTPGSYGIDPTGLDAANYAILFETGTLRVVAAPPVLNNGNGNGMGMGMGVGNANGFGGGGAESAASAGVTGGVAPLRMEGGMGSGLFATAPTDTASGPGTVWLQVVREPTAGDAGFTLVYVPASVRNAAQGFRFALPDLALAGVDKDSPVQVTLLSGDALPDWLRFDASTRMFVASRVPPGGLPLRVRVVAGGKSSMLELLETSN